MIDAVRTDALKRANETGKPQAIFWLDVLFPHYVIEDHTERSAESGEYIETVWPRLINGPYGGLYGGIKPYR